MALCLRLLGDTVVLGPVSPTNMNGAIDSPPEPLGPLYLDSPRSIGRGTLDPSALGGTSVLELHAAPRRGTSLDVAVRTTVLVTAFSYGVTDHLDASLVLPIVQEDADVHLRIGPFSGRTTFRAAGVSDLSARLKYQFHPNLAATVKAIFPTGDSARGFGMGSYWLAPGLVASLPIGDRLELNAEVAGELNLSSASQSGLSYGVGLSGLVGPLAVVAEFLGSTGLQNSLSVFDVTYGDGRTFDVAFGIRAPLPLGFLVFAAGTYALDHDGIRPAGVAPVLGVSWQPML